MFNVAMVIFPFYIAGYYNQAKNHKFEILSGFITIFYTLEKVYCGLGTERCMAREMFSKKSIK